MFKTKNISKELKKSLKYYIKLIIIEYTQKTAINKKYRHFLESNTAKYTLNLAVKQNNFGFVTNSPVIR